MKKIVFFLFVGLISNISFAQLTVKGSSYIYADDVVVFVEKDVELAAADDYFYLRNGAQLIQGTGSIGNSGQGQLSIQQSGTVNRWSYHYWGSPVGNTEANNTLNRKFRADNNIYEQTIAPITSVKAAYFTGNSYDGTPSPSLKIADYWLWTYNPGTAYGEWDQVRSTGYTDVGYGFTMKGVGTVDGAAQLYDFRGKPNTGNITVNVEQDKFTLVGNPYPSAISANDLIWKSGNGTKMDGTLYFWEHDQTKHSHYLVDYVGGYATYTITADGALPSFTNAPFSSYNGDGTQNGPDGSPSGTSKHVYPYIPVGQGFMIKGLVNGGIVTFTNAMRVFVKESVDNSEFFRVEQPTKESLKTDRVASVISNSDATSTTESNLDVHGHPVIEYDENGFNIVPAEYKRFRLNINFNGAYTRHLLQNFHESATEGFDRGLESQSASGLEQDAYWIQNDNPYVVQAHKMNLDLTIPLVLNIVNAQNIKFSLIDIQNFDVAQPIYLHDTFNNNYFDLRSQNNIEMYLEPALYTTRFEITFRQGAALSVDDEYASQLQLFQNNGQSEVTILNPNSLEVKDFKLYDINGRLILSKNKLELKNKYTFNTSALSVGVYIANIKLAESDVLITKKIVINK